MKYLNKLMLGIIGVASFLAACDKADIVPTYKSGIATVLSVSTTTLAAPASDSDNAVLKFMWTNPMYATDSNTIKYILQIDTANGTFSNPTSFAVSGTLSDTLTGRQINDMLLNTYGLKIKVPYNFTARLISSYANNNDQKISNTITLSLTAYVIPPKVTPPAAGHLYIIGDGTAGGWAQPVPTPASEFSQIDSLTYGGVFYFPGGGHYDFLPVNGSWNQKYTVPDNTVSGLANGGSFQFYDVGVSGGQDMPGPATAGWYTVIVDFQLGKYTVTPFNTNGDTFSGNLFIIGDATAWGWNQPVPTPTQQFTQDNSAQYHLTIPLISTGSYLVLLTNGSYDKFAVNDNTIPGLWAGGAFGSELGQNFPAPPTDGTYTITVNLATLTFNVK